MRVVAWPRMHRHWEWLKALAVYMQVRAFYWARAEADHSADRVADLALWMRGVLTWQTPSESWKWLGGGVYGVMVVREVATRLCMLNPVSLMVLAALGVLLGDRVAAQVLPIVSAVLKAPKQVRTLCFVSRFRICSGVGLLNGSSDFIVSSVCHPSCHADYMSTVSAGNHVCMEGAWQAAQRGVPALCT